MTIWNDATALPVTVLLLRSVLAAAALLATAQTARATTLACVLLTAPAAVWLTRIFGPVALSFGPEASMRAAGWLLAIGALLLVGAIIIAVRSVDTGQIGYAGPRTG